MKTRSLGILLLARVVVGLIWRIGRPRSEPVLLVQGRTIQDWLQSVEIGGEPDRKDPAVEALIAAGPQIVPDLSRVLLAFESPKDLAMRLPHAFVSAEKKYVRANESEILALKARAAWVMGAVA